MTLAYDDLERSARHLVLREVGGPGQQKLKGASALIVGMGGLGSPAALHRAACGFGSIFMVDPDVVEPSNLQRHVIYSEEDVGLAKVEAAADRLHALNPYVFLGRRPDAFDES